LRKLFRIFRSSEFRARFPKIDLIDFPFWELAKSICTRRAANYTNPAAGVAPTFAPEFARDESFAELLRHELNNPLTGFSAMLNFFSPRCAGKNSAPLSAPGVSKPSPRLPSACAKPSAA
jgi:hypothetical protein